MNPFGLSPVKTKHAVREVSEAAYLLDGDSHRWMLPSASLEVDLNAAALDRLAHDLNVIRKRARPGEQIGGLLLGVADALGRISVRIETIETYSAGALHQLLALVSKHRVDPAALAVVGCYRLCRPDETAYSRADESLMREHFADPGELLLLLRPADTAPSPMQFVFWRGGELGMAEATFPRLLGPRVAVPPPGVPVLPVPIPEPARSRPVALADEPRPIRLWTLVGLALLTAVLVFLGGMLWNRGNSAAPASPAAAAIPVPLPLFTQAPATSVAAAPVAREPEPRRFENSAETRRAEFTPQAPHVIAPTRHFAPPSAVPAAAAADPAALPAPPVTEAQKLQAPDLAQLHLPAVAPPPAPAKPASAISQTQAATTGAQPSRPGSASPAPASPAPASPGSVAPGPVTPAIVLKQSHPVVPADLRTLITRRMIVEITLTIDANGRVVDAEPAVPMSGLSQSLARLACNAARLWSFRPAQYQGHPVLSVSHVRFSFDPHK